MTTNRSGRAPATDTPSDAGAYPDSREEAEMGHEGGSAARRPRWVTVVGIAAVVLVVLIMIVLHLSGAVGPGSH